MLESNKRRPRVIITGAASGIGRASAIRFANEGCDVLVNDTNRLGLDALLKELAPGLHLSLAGSYTSPETMIEGAGLITSHWGSVDALVNCAGVSGKSDAVSGSLQDWRPIFDTMVDGCFLMTQLAVQFMSYNGRIIHITSIHGTRAEPSTSSYSMAKAAIDQFCRAMAVELAGRNILVNAIAPGFVDTAMSMVDGISELRSDWFQSNYVDGHHLPLRRAAQPEEIAGVAWFLAGPDASYITGQVLTVDGGLTITF